MNYVSAVLGIFVILLSGIWLGYRKQYQGPAFGVILGSSTQQGKDEVVSLDNEKNGSEKISALED
jgi:hypothetical protein